MDGDRFDGLVRALGSRRGVFRLTGAGFFSILSGASSDAMEKNRRRHKRRQRRRRDRRRVRPVFTTCHTATAELGPIPGGPFPTCRSKRNKNQFVPCDPKQTFRALADRCNAAYPECAGACRLLSGPTVGLGDCDDYSACDVYDNTCNTVTLGSIPGGPYPSCWSWSDPSLRCWNCPGRTPDYYGMIAICGQGYPAQRYDGCFIDTTNACVPGSDASRKQGLDCPT